MKDYGYNSRYLTQDGQPWFPVMGEIHYSRVPESEWLDRLRKMRSGGVDIVSSYVIWIHHEEREGCFDFDGSRNLRRFVECCRDCGLTFFLRIGPWSHAEVRHGGLPDWLLEKSFEPRSNDPEYFEHVRRFYQAIFREVEGLFCTDGGPIIGVQIENEYGHCGGLTGDAGEMHMRTLAHMARDIGFNVPYYTATGWGGAMTAGLLPVMGGYCEAPWDPRITVIEPSGNYIFTHERNDHSIGSDYGVNETLSFDPSKFPYLTAELGGGLQVTHRRRPVASGRDIGAMSLVKLGSGANLLGYYMYSGGTNPQGRHSTLHESKRVGDANDLPALSYDFRAPLREYGQLGEAYGEIKRLAIFLKDFGDALCEMETHLPESNPLFPDDTEHLRTAIRSNGRSGYIFVNNYQRRQAQASHPSAQLVVPTDDGEIKFPPIDIKDGDYFFFPFGLKIGAAMLKSALATPLCILNASKYVFYSDVDPCYTFEGDFDISNIITITRAQSLQAYKITLDKEYLIMTEGALTEDASGICFESNELLRFKVFPDFSTRPEAVEYVGKEGVFHIYEKQFGSCKPYFGIRIESDASQIKASCEARKAAALAGDILSAILPGAIYVIDCDMPQMDAIRSGEIENLRDIRLRIRYRGDRARLLVNGKVVTDDFWSGPVWEVALGRYHYPARIEIHIFPMLPKDEIYLEYQQEYMDGVACSIESVECEVRFETRLIRP